ncbi:MAG: hypothetical protein HN742_38080 [Lentisphaerae bacterium]|jgi:hypothetical protein|nr:hypothetical protein [Lentisphaerota bacterium]MBT4814865.1 hypothetical protein [Lentisphaerota bacterium]MBT5611979.1 hypothetical protein [Lentisphaerota bacterium]MBT7060899.1 hypothetical protein [Lentisphaerota bacterium]MBT7847738.1 hypothetical protein [Lentisphaerota bacterium]
MSKRRSHPAVQRELDQAIHLGLKAEGWILPTTPEQVASAEEHLWEMAPWPDESEPPDFADIAATNGDLGLSLNTGDRDFTLVEETLARAAREGGELSPEVEEAMHQDRAAAEARGHHSPTD